MRLRHRVEMLGLDTLGTLVRRLPLRSAARLVGGLGVVAGGVFRVRRQTVDRNLRIAFPQASGAERRKLANRAYRHLATQSSILFRMLVDDDALDTLVSAVVLADDGTPEVVQWMQDRSRNGQGTLILGGHFGNWEVGAGAFTRLGMPLTAVATTQSNPGFDRRIRRLRARLGLDLIARPEARSEVPKALAAGKSVLLVADQFTWDGVPIRFFGSPTLAARGPAVFARRARVPAVFLAAVAGPNDPSAYTLHLTRIEAIPPASGADATLTSTQLYFDHLERAIRANPEQYLWHHRRWRPLEGRVDAATLQRLSRPE